MSQYVLATGNSTVIKYGFDHVCGYFFHVLIRGALIEGVTSAFSCSRNEKEMGRGEMMEWLNNKKVWTDTKKVSVWSLLPEKVQLALAMDLPF